MQDEALSRDEVRYWRATIRYWTNRFLGGTDTGSYVDACDVVPDPVPLDRVSVESVDVAAPATREEWQAWQASRQRATPPQPIAEEPVFDPDDDFWPGGVLWVAEGTMEIFVATAKDPDTLEVDDIEDDLPTAFMPEEFAGEAQPDPSV